MKIRDIMEGIEIIEVNGNIDIEVSGISYDSRKTEVDDVFVCISGFKVDGHSFVEKAISKGATAIVVEKEINIPTKKVPVIRVMDTRASLSRMSANLFNHPTEAMNVFGITGTNGKTTITYMIKEIHRMADLKCGLLGTISYQIGNKVYSSSNTTPESYELQKMFKEMRHLHIDSCAMEVSSHSLELKRVEDVCFNYGVFTNLTPDHLDFHQDFKHYYNSKKKLFYKTNKANMINIDDTYGKELADELDLLETPCYTYAIEKDAHFMAINLKRTQRFSSFDVVYNNNLLGQIKLSIPGLFSIYNALAAASVCYVAGIGFNIIKEALENIKGVPGRFEMVHNDKDYLIIVDYAHTPDALEKVLKTANEFKVGRMICVFGCGGERDRKKRPLMGKVAGLLSDYCIITNDNPRSEDPNQIFRDTIAGIEGTNCKYEILEDRYEAIKRAVEIYKKNDIIILAGKGHETYQVIGNQSIHFDDKEAVLKAIEELE